MNVVTGSGLESDATGKLSTDSVLIAEDDPFSRRLLENCLQKWNFRVTFVDNGVDAWRVLQEIDCPQMAILDWIMPGLDGLELCRRIRSMKTDAYKYVVLLTAKDSKEDVVAGLEAGADGFSET
jgi:DNA-binding response OmpR family regulator